LTEKEKKEFDNIKRIW